MYSTKLQLDIEDDDDDGDGIRDREVNIWNTEISF